MTRALLLDVGGVVIRTPFELLAGAERRHGLAPGALGRRGVFDPEGDPEFDRVRRGELTERDFWAGRAQRAASLLGSDPDMRSFARVLFDVPEDEVTRPETVALLTEAKTAGLDIGMLTNDLYDFHGRDWVERIGVFDVADVLVDVSEHGVLKPDPRAFEIGIAAMGRPADDLVFLDDQPVNVVAAREAGMTAMEVDVTDPEKSMNQARAVLGL